MLLEAPPGAGKTSVVPLALLADVASWRESASSSSSAAAVRPPRVVVLEPRRVAARSAAARLATAPARVDTPSRERRLGARSRVAPFETMGKKKLSLILKVPCVSRFVCVFERSFLCARAQAAALGEDVGGVVGYAVRGDARVSRLTRLVVMTDGFL